jgi:hypothetical protein
MRYPTPMLDSSIAPTDFGMGMGLGLGIWGFGDLEYYGVTSAHFVRIRCTGLFDAFNARRLRRRVWLRPQPR